MPDNKGKLAFSDYAKENPIAVNVKRKDGVVRVALGAPITQKAKPPKRGPRVIPLATDADLQILRKMGGIYTAYIIEE